MEGILSDPLCSSGRDVVSEGHLLFSNNWVCPGFDWNGLRGGCICPALAQALLASERGAALMKHVVHLSKSITKVHPAIFECFLGVLSGAMRLYENIDLNQKRVLNAATGSPTKDFQMTVFNPPPKHHERSVSEYFECYHGLS